MKSNFKKGFTLIELLVVIVIIGILATIGVAQFSNYFAKTRDTARKTNIAQANTILVAYAVSNETNSFPEDATAAEAELVKNGLSLKVPDTDDYSYYYGTDSDQNEFVIAVCSEESAEETSQEVFEKGSLGRGVITCNEGNVPESDNTGEAAITLTKITS